jgi:hypothetical protein
MAQSKTQYREWCIDRRAKGLCQKCKNKRNKGSALCEAHILKQRANAQRKRARRNSAGKCSKCEEPLAPNSVLCRKHLMANRLGNYRVSAVKAEAKRERMLIEGPIKSAFALAKEKKRLTIEQLKADAALMRIVMGKCAVENCRWNAMPDTHTCLLHGPALRSK